jgi:DNA-binding transcriptional ArsR family regulator
MKSAEINLSNDIAISRLAAAIGEPSRARMLCCLLDGHARTSTELAMVAEVSPSTASVHLSRLKAERLVKLFVQGKHRYYSLEGSEVARALEALLVVSGNPQASFKPTTPLPLRRARTCYDHMAGALAVSLLRHFTRARWIITPTGSEDDFEVTPAGIRAFESMGIELAAARALRRRFAYACLDWSERKPHIGGALGAALLQMALKRKWFQREFDSRTLNLTRLGQRELSNRFGIEL